MRAMLPPNKLLASTIVATSIALAIKTVTLINTAPTLHALMAGTTEALEVASTARVISQASAAQSPSAAPEASPASLPHASVPAPAPAPVPASLPSVPAPTPASLPGGPVQSTATPQPEAKQARANAADDGNQEITLRQSPTDEREKRLSEREAAIAAVDKHLADRVTELLAIQSRLEALENERKAHEGANWGGLVKLYEDMKPRDAAKIFNTLDKPVLLELLDRMKPAKASPVIAQMEPESARQITADLAAKRTHSTTLNN